MISIIGNQYTSDLWSHNFRNWKSRPGRYLIRHRHYQWTLKSRSCSLSKLSCLTVASLFTILCKLTSKLILNNGWTNSTRFQHIMYSDEWPEIPNFNTSLKADLDKLDPLPSLIDPGLILDDDGEIFFHSKDTREDWFSLSLSWPLNFELRLSVSLLPDSLDESSLSSFPISI